MTTQGAEMPAAYDGREQAYIKHQLLEGYLEKLFLIVGMSASKLGIKELCYVDCFAGPWLDDSQQLSTTSIAISLRSLEKCRETIGSFGSGLKCRALYVEQNSQAIIRLRSFLANRTATRVSADAMHGDFVKIRNEILKWCGDDAFVFFFIDPKGWQDIGVKILEPLLARRRSEFLLNFQYDFVNRTASMLEWRDEIALLLGGTVSVEGLTPERREERLVDTYRNNLKHQMPSVDGMRARSAYVRVLDPKKDRPKYHLVYLTSHPRGVIEFMETSQKVDLIQKRVRASKKEQSRATKTGMSDMFGSESLIDLNEGHAGLVDVDDYWTKYLGQGVRHVGETEFADILEQTNWFPDDLQASLGRLITSGHVKNLDAPRKRPRKPLHWKDNERLQLERGPI